MNIISIIVAIVIAYISYRLFKNYGFKTALVVAIVINVVKAVIQNGFSGILMTVLLTLIITIIEISIQWFAYSRSNSFWGYFFLVLLVEAVILIVISLVGAILMTSISAPSSLLKPVLPS